MEKFCARPVRLGPLRGDHSTCGWYKEAIVPEVTEQKIQASEDILLDVDPEIGSLQPVSRKVAKEDVTQPAACERSLYTDSSRKGHDDFAHWDLILKKSE